MAQNSYTVLARKWRPATFEDIVGQQHICTTLRNALREGRIAHAYLFCGPRGVGKTTTARVLARALNCEKGPIDEPCGVCSACQQISAGNFMDVLEIDGASNRGIDEVRELRESVRFSPAKGRYRVVVIDEVHMLTHAAFNALLKTLEEPPAHAVFVLATTEAGQVLPTIVSRCQRFDFHLVSADDMVKRLQTIVVAEELNVDPEALVRIAGLSEGSLRDAEGLLDQLVSYVGSERATSEDVLALARGTPRERLSEIIESMASQRPDDLLVRLDALFSIGTEPSVLLSSLLKYVRELLLVKLGSTTTRLLQLDSGSMEALEAQASLLSMADVMMLLTSLADVEPRLKWSGMPRLVLEVTLLKACDWIPAASVKDLLSRLAETDSSVAEEPVRSEAPPATRPVSVSVEKSVPAETASAVRPQEAPEKEDPPSLPQEPALQGLDWPALVDKVKAAKPMLGIAIQKAVPEWNDADKTLTLDVADPLPREQLRTEACVQLIERIAKELVGCSLRVIVSRESSRKPSRIPVAEAQPPPEAREPAPKKASPPAERDPRVFVQDAMQMFNASVVKTSSGEDGHALPSPVTRKRAEGGS